MQTRSCPPRPFFAAAAATLALLAVPAALTAATRNVVTPDDLPWPALGEGRQVSPDPSCKLDLSPALPGEYRRQITGNGWLLDACGTLHRTGPVTGPLPGANRISGSIISTNTTQATIDSIATWNYYSDTYSPFNGIETLGSATRYYLSDGSSWQSGAGSARVTRARLLSSQVHGDSVYFLLIPPPDSVLYQQTDFSFGDHSSQGTLTVAGPMVIRARIGDTDAEMDGLGYVHDNDITSYGEPAFNYFSALVGSVVPYRVQFRLSSGTWSSSTLDGTFSYSLTGIIDFAHPVSSPKLKSLVVSGPSQVPDHSTAQFGTVATFDGGTTRDVTGLATWSVRPAALASVSAGQLVTQPIPRDTVTLVLHASYTQDGVTQVSEKPVLCRRDLLTTGINTWPTFQANERHDGYVPLSLRVADFKPAWSTTLGSGQALNPVSAAEGRVFCSLISYFGSGEMFFALDARDGHTMWTKSSSAFSVNPPAAAYGNAYLQTCNNGGDTWFFAFDGATGSQIFKSPFGAQWEHYYAPTPYKGQVYFDGGTYGGMYDFDALSGQQGWFLGLPQYDQWTPSVDSSYVYAYVGEYSPGLYVAHRENAAQAFMIPDPSFNWDGWSMNGAAVLGSQSDVVAHHDGRLIRFDLASRTISWQIATGFLDQPSLAKGSIYVVRSGALSVLDERSGALRWSWSPRSGQLAGPVIVTDSHVFASSMDSVYAIDVATHQRAWAYRGSGALALGNGQLYIASATGRLDAVTVGGAPAVVLRADAGPDTTIDCTGGDARGVAVRLDGRRSTGSVPLSFQWSATGVTFDDPTSPTPTGWFAPGETDVRLSVSGGGQQSSDTVRVTVSDHTAPTLRVDITPGSLWPPDHRLVPVTAKVVATDGCDPSPHWKLVSITETDLGVGPEVAAPEADVQGATIGAADTDLMLRAERPGEGDGRLYTLWFEASDASGNRARASGSVLVPHDQSGRASLVPTSAGARLTLYGARAGDLRGLDPASVAVRSGNTDVLVPAGGEIALSDVDHDGVPDATLEMKSVPSAVASGGALWVRWNVGAHTSLATLNSVTTAVGGSAAPIEFTATVSPNPVRFGSSLHYTLPRAGHVRVRIFDVSGRLVATPVDMDREAGAFEASLAGLTTGHARLYLYSIEWQGERRSGKLVVMN